MYSNQITITSCFRNGTIYDHFKLYETLNLKKLRKSVAIDNCIQVFAYPLFILTLNITVFFNTICKIDSFFPLYDALVFQGTYKPIKYCSVHFLTICTFLFCTLFPNVHSMKTGTSVQDCILGL